MIAVIGDIHGCFNTLKLLVNEVRRKYGQVDIYSTGDLIDRGKYPHLVIEYVMSEDIKPVLGNHECMFYHYHRVPGSYLGAIWRMNDYRTTVYAYNVGEHLLEEHLAYIATLPFFYNLQECFISHAGIAKRLRMKLFSDNRIDEKRLLAFNLENLEADYNIIWNRGDLLDIGKLQVVGHTRKREVEMDEYSNALYLDTSAFSGNSLSCVVLENQGIVEAFSAETDLRDL